MNYSKKAVNHRRKTLTFRMLKKKGRMHSVLFRCTLLISLTLFLSVAGLGLGFIQAIYRSTPTMTIASLLPKGQSSKMYDSNRNVFCVIKEENFKKNNLSLKQIPQHLQNAIISIEDPNFYEHAGVDSYSIANAILDSLTRDTVYGSCSLITEQLIENMDTSFLSNSTLFTRIEYSLRLHFKALSLEENAEKPQILETYLNTISFGDGIIGVDAASQAFFHKSATDLTLSESTVLAAMVADPYKYHPITQQESSKSRRITILETMLEEGFITEKEMRSALLDNPYPALSNETVQTASSFTGFSHAALKQIAKDMMKEYDISATKFYTLLTYGDLKIYTTQDTELQNAANDIINTSSYYSGGCIDAQAGLTVLEQTTGQVRAIIGGRNGDNALLNRTTEETRQPGTLFHVLATYVPGIDMGTLTLASTYEDSPYQYLDNKKEVLSKDGIYDGITTIREAMGQEMNIIAARAQSDVTSQISYEYLTDMGFQHLTESAIDSTGNTITDVSQSICSGSLIDGVTNLEITQAVSTLGNSGFTTEGILYTRITDKNEEIILEKNSKNKKTISSGAAFLVTDALLGEESESTDTSALVKLHGSNQEKTDYWCSGYTPNYTATIWLGYDDNRTFESDLTEERLWNAIMDIIQEKEPVNSFLLPGDLETALICQESGKLAVPSICDEDPRGDRTRMEYFLPGTLPTTTCNTHVEVTICSDSGMLISNDCPKKKYQRKIYIVLPDGNDTTLDAKYQLPKKYVSDQRCTIHSHE